jgi:hypothetical protein
MMHVDLSSPGLQPDAVVSFVLSHTEPRPGENILFKVSQEAFEAYLGDLPRAVVVPQEEADAINEFLDAAWPRETFFLTGYAECTNCGRTLTFYDLFVSGRKRHGDALMRRILSGSEFHLQVAGREARQEIDCTNCGELNVLTLDGDGAYQHYSGSGYTYA